MTGYSQATIAAPLSFKGAGLHTAKRHKITLLPAPVNTGIIFRVIKKKGADIDIPAHWQNTKNLPLCTCLVSETGEQVRTVEHLMAALYACGISNVIVEVEGKEIPIMDGSARPFIEGIDEVGIAQQHAQQKVYRVTEKVEYTEDKRYVRIEPADSLHLDLAISLTNFGRLHWSGEVTPETFKQEIASARTFGRLKNGLLAQLTRFQKDPVCLGANTKTAVVIVKDKAINKGGLRMENELIFHRALDMVGDLMLSGGIIQGKITANSPAHRLNHGLLQAIFEQGSYIEVGAETAPESSLANADENNLKSSG
ncbi:UDP-3-O-acyl-N-acetylglucosamine deacetylase [Cocleimonas sp. KMM 6892]|uniref:UDP-3-O-acyl-N-acetylglucosamine deacetylase n=1 Tax=unclassified Cocleimonas TaxID=2639732 RepID=UPI002DB8B4E0|nr:MULTISPECIES: UDP-3-O-acyl-N-acetylglucosamine deacetylase [unclassified Cocleimonas]MEB8432489.1 UDP-3-O-acyl-N-acetylglucosamine deacetylase [Cocleimonas sp. KMM 6892]MEC4715348.1 UDP-3-O-acyl-N-acetylglucosamine deacetylase [Cocleimonas sp. KMM 6895]MEC4745033.1 UDP-3-O-acyl-N-acetylglucosamine deacetylase [Cocleimonas sp. KMM 6896]